MTQEVVIQTMAIVTVIWQSCNKKSIENATCDLLHWGHINLLQWAKASGGDLIVGITNDNIDRNSGKLNVRNNVSSLLVLNDRGPWRRFKGWLDFDEVEFIYIKSVDHRKEEIEFGELFK